jgi:hypothetical protein
MILPEIASSHWRRKNKTQDQEDVTQEKGADMMAAPRTSKEVFSASVLRTTTDRYCTVKVTASPCAAPPPAVAVTVICDVPNAVGVATVTNVDPGFAAAADVAVTVTVAGFGTTAGAVYRPVPSTVPLALPFMTAQVTLWLVEPFTVAANCC